MTPHTEPPDGARFVMLHLYPGNEAVGWFDRQLGFILKHNVGERPLNVIGWRELTEQERNNIGLND